MKYIVASDLGTTQRWYITDSKSVYSNITWMFSNAKKFDDVESAQAYLMKHTDEPGNWDVISEPDELNNRVVAETLND